MRKDPIGITQYCRLEKKPGLELKTSGLEHESKASLGLKGDEGRQRRGGESGTELWKGGEALSQTSTLGSPFRGHGRAPGPRGTGSWKEQIDDRCFH